MFDLFFKDFFLFYLLNPLQAEEAHAVEDLDAAAAKQALADAQVMPVYTCCTWSSPDRHLTT